MGNKIHLACWRGDVSALEYYTQDSEYRSPKLKMPDVFGVYPIHILVYRGHTSKCLWDSLFKLMDDYHDCDVTFNGVTAMDLTIGKPTIQRKLLAYQTMLKGKYFYRLGQMHTVHHEALHSIFKHYQQNKLSDALLPQLGPQNIHGTLYPGAPSFFTPLFIAVLANDASFLKAIISRGARPDHQPPDLEANYNLLHFCAHLDHYQLIPTLAMAGCPIATVAMPDKFDTPLVIAAQRGNIQSIYVLCTLPGFSLESSLGLHALQAAARNGQFLAIRTLVKLGCNANSPLPRTRITPLHAAAQGDHVGAVKTLLELGADPFSVTIHQETALHFAARYGSSQVVPTLIEAGLSPYQQQPDGVMNPLCISIWHEELSVLKELVNFERPIPSFYTEFNLLHFALKARFHLSNVKQMKSSSDARDCEILFSFRMGSVNFTYSIPSAAYNANYDCVSLQFLKEIINLGSDIMEADENTGFLPIHAAAYLNDAEAIQLLIDVGCPCDSLTVNTSDGGSRMTPLQVAAMRDSIESIKVLAGNGCKINFHYPQEDPPVHIAISYGSVRALAALLQLGADVNLENYNGIFPLQMAAVCNQPKMIELLVEFGASVSAEYSKCQEQTIMEEVCHGIDQEMNDVLANGRDISCMSHFASDNNINPNRTAVKKLLRQSLLHHPTLVLAVMANSCDAVRKLLDLGADPNTNVFCSNVLLCACQSGNSEMASHLIAFGAHMEATDALGNRPIHSAIKSNQPAVVQVLIGSGCNAISPKITVGHLDLTPFQLTSLMCRPRILPMLHELNPVISQEAVSNLSPLHLALIGPNVSFVDHDWSAGNATISLGSQEETVKLLLSFGCNANSTDHEGLTPLDLALYYKSDRLVQLLTMANVESGDRIMGREQLAQRIQYLEKEVGCVVTEPLKHRLDVLEGQVGSLESRVDRMEARLQKLEIERSQQCMPYAQYIMYPRIFPSDLFGTKAVKSFMHSFLDTFMKAASAKEVASNLYRRKVIPEPVETEIERALDRKTANGHLYDHLYSQGTLETIQVVCDVFIKEEGYPRMNELGERMKRELAHRQYIIEK
jgi:ankyrin repeat protein